jgi:hypothetical protein
VHRVEGNDASFKEELIHDADFVTRAQARAAIVEYIEVFYNKQAGTPRWNTSPLRNTNGPNNS